MDLKADGLKTKPHLMHTKKFLWEAVFELICPT
jgi:hypothetical protein